VGSRIGGFLTFGYQELWCDHGSIGWNLMRDFGVFRTGDLLFIGLNQDLQPRRVSKPCRG
jgi:hypothetical protein